RRPGPAGRGAEAQHESRFCRHRQSALPQPEDGHAVRGREAIGRQADLLRQGRLTPRIYTGEAAPDSTIAAVIAKVFFWTSLGALAWTQAGYPLAAALLARVRARPVRKGDFTPTVSVVVAAHNEQGVIQRRLENLLALDYPADRFDIIVASDES